jgi:hypothetical protein
MRCGPLGLLFTNGGHICFTRSVNHMVSGLQGSFYKAGVKLGERYRAKAQMPDQGGRDRRSDDRWP